jgi:preprotein translocase subunit SecF
MYNDIRAAGGDFEILEENEVGAVIGQELTVKAIQGVFVGLLLILIYITIRLSFDFAVFAIIALAHDVLILCTVFAIFGFEINSPFVAVLLTVVGYSINDTIIIYDRIRENMKIKRHLTFDMMVNQSLLETMARSINTSGTTLLAILAILILGGISLQAFMVGLGVGIFAGTYSSIFIASPLLVLWRMKKEGTLEIEKEVKPVIDMISDDDDEDEEEESGTDQITGLSGPVSPKPSSGRKKRRRRRQ